MATKQRRKTARRGRGEASIFQRDMRGKLVWVAVLDLGKDESDKRKRVTVYGDTKQEATEKLKEKMRLKDERKLTASTPTKAGTLGEWLDEWIAAPGKRPNSIAAQGQKIRLYLKPIIGGVKLSQLNPAHVKRLMTAMRTDDKSETCIADAVDVLRAAVRAAAVEGKLSFDPLAGMRRPKREKRKAGDSYTPEECTKLLAVADQVPQVGPMIALGLMTGLRLGELQGLQWRDIDISGGTLQVSRQWRRGGGYAPPKSESSARTIRLNSVTLDLLNRQRQSALVSGLYAPDAPVFFGETGRPQTRVTVYRRFVDLCDLAGVRRLRIHDLRHTATSLAIASGASVLTVQQLCGHADAKTTLGTYSHLFAGSERETAERMARLVAAG